LKPVSVFRGILAGCKFSVAMTRVYLMRSMRELTAAHPDANTCVFVDDTSMQNTSNTFKDICDTLVPALECFRDKVKFLKISLSPKAVITTSSPRLTKM